MIFEVSRPDRLVDPRAREEACVALQDLPGETDLTRAERAFTLCFLASMEILHGSTGASPGTLDDWTREALALAPEPLSRATRGEARLAAGRQADAEALLREALAGFEARNEAAGAQAVLCRASLGHACCVAGGREEAQAWFTEAESSPVARDNGVSALITLIKLQALRSGSMVAGDAVLAGHAR